MIRLIILAIMLYSTTIFAQEQKVYVESEVYVLDGNYEQDCMEHETALWVDPIFLESGLMMDSVLYTLDFQFESTISGTCQITQVKDFQVFYIELPNSTNTVDAKASALVRGWRNGVLIGEQIFPARFCNNQLAKK